MLAHTQTNSDFSSLSPSYFMFFVPYPWVIFQTLSFNLFDFFFFSINEKKLLFWYFEFPTTFEIFYCISTIIRMENENIEAY